MPGGGGAPLDRFRGLYEECYRPVLAYALRRSPEADAHDVAAETFTVAWRRLDDVPPEAPLPWLYGVARRVLANQRRGNDRRLRLVRRLEAEPATVSKDDSTDEDDAIVLAAFRRLRAEDQEVLRLAAWEGLRPAEIAAVLGRSPNAASILLHRARNRLRDVIADLEKGQASSRTQGPRRMQRDG